LHWYVVGINLTPFNPSITMSRTEKINQIIESREEFATKTGDAISRLYKVKDALDGRANGLAKAAAEQRYEEQVSAIQILSEECKRHIKRLADHTEDLKVLKSRFQRKTLNIGIIGNAGQGKSTFIQRLTGLTDEEIPTVAGANHCTGAPSIIQNSENPGDTPRAKVTFYTEGEFVEMVLKPFYRQLRLGSGPERIRNFSEFVTEFPSLTEPDFTGDTTGKALFDELCQLHGSLSSYRPLLGSGELDIEKNRFREFIAKINIDGNPVYNWVAVKNVKITCPFTVSDVGRVSICDTPGMGDFYSESDQMLAKNIGENIDAVVMMKKTSARIFTGDTNLYDLIFEAIPELDSKNWSYCILNKDNTADISRFEEAFKGRHIVTRCNPIPIDCRDAGEVSDAFDQIITGIADSQKDLDNTLYKERFKKVQETLDAVTVFAAKLATLFPQSVGNEKDRDLAEIKYRLEIQGKLKTKLNELMRKRRESVTNIREAMETYRTLQTGVRDTSVLDDNEFWKAINEVETSLSVVPGLPNEGELLGGDEERSTKYTEIFQRIRNRITRKFNGLDDALSKMVTDMRKEVEECFTSPEGGRLGDVTFPQWGEEGRSWWSCLAEEIRKIGKEIGIEEYSEYCNDIAELIEQFCQETLTFENLYSSQVQPILDELTAVRERYRYVNNSTVLELENQLICAGERAKNGAVGLLRENVALPYSELYTKITTMHDAVFRSTAAASWADFIWSKFYATHRSEIWKEEFGEREKDAEFRNKWQKDVKDLQEITDSARKSADT